MTQLYGENGQWLRVNLHTHTTVSDGAFTPEQTMRLYAEHGYDALALTDHWKQSEAGEFGSTLMLSGCEWDVPSRQGYAETVHIVGIGMSSRVELTREGLTAQKVVDAINAADGIAILAHPAWSVTVPGILNEVSGFAGSEVWNSASAFPFTGRPDSTEFFDQCAQQGSLLRMMAADDSHWYKSDALAGWTWVYAKARTREAILDAIRAGRFYASCGPKVASVSRDGANFHVECDQPCTIGFLSNSCWMSGRVFSDATAADYTMKDFERWLRIEVIDADGKRAWLGMFPSEK